MQLAELIASWRQPNKQVAREHVAYLAALAASLSLSLARSLGDRLRRRATRFALQVCADVAASFTAVVAYNNCSRLVATTTQNEDDQDALSSLRGEFCANLYVTQSAAQSTSAAIS